MTPILHCKRYGFGEPLLILHGLFGCWDNWHPVAKVLSQRFCVFVPDLRNHGRSFHSPQFDYDVMAGDIRSLMDALALDRAVLLGHSMGGKVALRFAALHPEPVQRLIVVDITHKAVRSTYGEAVEALAQLDLRSLGSLKDAEAKLRQAVPDPVVRLFLLKNLEHRLDGAYRWKVNVDAIRRNLPLICGPVDIGEFTKPCLFIRGSQSNYIDGCAWSEIRSSFPQAQLVTIPGSGHWPHADNKAAFLAAVNGFLDGH
jgi:pimeloyl-ACP methyl ester carboxylesterase